MRSSTTGILILILAVCPLSGCDRDFGGGPQPVVEVVEPDLTMVQSEAEIDVTLRVDSPRDIDRVTVSGHDFSFDETTSTWMGSVPLETGFNLLHVRSFIDDDQPVADTLNAFRTDVSIEDPGGLFLPDDRGGHAVVRTPDDRLILVGGAMAPGGPGTFDILTLEPGQDRFRFIVSHLFANRVGHTLVALPDGRVLIAGGGIRGNIQGADELVEFVEIFDPADESFSVAPLTGAPIRRMYHTANLRQVGDRLILDLIGGRGDIRYTPEPEVGIRRDLRSFEFRNDSLFAIHPAVGPFIEQIAGHSLTPLDAATTSPPERYLISGMTFGDTLEPVALTIDFASAVGIDIRDAAVADPGTIRHAAAPIEEGVVALFGGRGEDPADTYNGIRIYSEAGDAWFSVDSAELVNFPARYGHTATTIGPGRILVLGGFDATGAALSEPRIVTFD